MRKYKIEEETKTIKKTVTEFVKCDLCGAKVPKPNATTKRFPEVDWSTGGYDTCETQISSSEGEHYPEGGHKITWGFDICPKCFMEKLVPWFESQGATVDRKEFDW